MTPETLTVHRGGTDKFGNRATSSTHEVSGAVAWGSWSRGRQERADTSSGTAELYVPAGSDLRKRDRVTRADGQQFTVIAGPMWDCPHPLSGHGFAWTVYQLEAVNG